MGCSSGCLPCQPPPPPAAAQPLARLSSVCDAECGLPQDGVDDGTVDAGGSTKPNLPPGPGPEPRLPKSPENYTLERLAQATGGAEKSWYRCLFSFGFISLVIGLAGTSVTFTFNTLPQIKVVSMLMLITGILMLLVAAICWRVRRARRRAKKEGGFFNAEQGTL
ncbi:transmembrane protein 100-like [Alosa sapidissima]|uniref:transmembrane protein 100-like n=1 Tax=Alosa sapidissima TaxID=34773 RepID=UPI001C08717E|nr:transmembrane protein 100-like [Alosa sapidissima]XP_041939745.1 transmembrane protein 100-like [Alosa sapidissima]